MKRLYILLLIIFCAFAASAQCPTGDVAFTSQQQLNDYKTQYSSCTAIQGGVAIVGGDITDLSSLSALVSISGTLQIVFPSSLTTLTGLNSLTYVGGQLVVTDAALLPNLTGFDKLKLIGQDLIIQATSSLTSLTGLGALESNRNLSFSSNNVLTSLSGLSSLTAINGSLSIGNNPVLSTCAIAPICQLLTNPSASVTIQDNGVGCNSQVQVRAACGSCSGNFAFLSQQDLNDFKTYATCPSIQGDLAIVGGDITDLSALSRITSVSGQFIITNNHSLTTLTGLNSLSYVGGQTVIDGNELLPNLTGLDGFKIANSSLIIQSNSSLTSVAGLSKLESTGDLHFSSNNALTSLSGFTSLTAIKGNLSIAGNATLSLCAIVPICQYLTNPNGTITISDNATGCNSENEVKNACSAMPVTLTKFLAQAEGKTAQLIWQTGFEKNADRFEIEHSLDALNWQKIGQIMAQGESEQLLDYRFSQANPANGVNYYRLKIVDLDATYAYSPIRSLRFSIDLATRLYPNPVSDKLYLQGVDWQTIQSVTIHDRAGKLLFKSTSPIDQGIDVHQLIGGRYVLTLHYSNAVVSTHSFVIP